jgi:hypothetical protein
MLCVLQRSSKYKFYSLWFDPTGFEPTIYRLRGEHCEVKSFYLPVISACTIYFENVLFIRNFQTFCQFCIRYSNEWVIVVKRTVSKLSAIMAKHETSVEGDDDVVCYLCSLAYVVSITYCVVFLFCLSSSCVLCTQCCPFLWIVNF